jgi:dTDP-glucose 4,6-dehydratase
MWQEEKKILITGSAGFIFSNFIRKVIAEDLPYEFVSIDAVLAKYNIPNIYEHPRHKFYMGDIADEKFVRNVFEIEKPDYVINGAAESFVDDAIASAIPFIHSNIWGTQVLIDASVAHKVEKFIQISTDEVYGHLTSKDDEPWTEASVPKPRNPYSASKYAAEVILHAASETHGLTYNITRCANNFGSRQPPRNLIPKIITSLIQGEKIPIHGDGTNIREWLYVDNHCTAIMKVLEDGKPNEIYNIGSGVEKTNLEMIDIISSIAGISPKIQFIPDRKGHDKRYSVNCDKLKSLGWKQEIEFEPALKKTVEWYRDNYEWYGKII